VAARSSDVSLYAPAAETEAGPEELDTQAARGFIKVWSLPLTAEARRKKG
jgi:argininosuccinate synthase